MKKPFNIIVCASGGGGNFKKLIDAQEKVGFTIKKLICDRNCGAIEHAINNDINYVLIDKKSLAPEEYKNRLNQELDSDTDLIVLAGFLSILSENICKKWENKIINTHPSLLPKYGGKGMYGVKVQEAVMANKEKYAGCTVHYVTSEIDGGDIILQKKIKVNYTETPWELGGRIFQNEGPLLIDAISKIMKEKNNQDMYLLNMEKKIYDR